MGGVKITKCDNCKREMHLDNINIQVIHKYSTGATPGTEYTDILDFCSDCVDTLMEVVKRYTTGEKK